MSKRFNVEELFREKLGQQELPPSAGMFDQIRRQWRWKQFFRFNPARLNIYYVAVALLGGSILLTALPGSEEPGTGGNKPPDRRQTEGAAGVQGWGNESAVPESADASPAEAAASRPSLSSDPWGAEGRTAENHPAGKSHAQSSDRRSESRVHDSAPGGAVPAIQDDDREEGRETGWNARQESGVGEMQPNAEQPENAGGTMSHDKTEGTELPLVQDAAGDREESRSLAGLKADFRFGEEFRGSDGYAWMLVENLTRGGSSYEWSLCDAEGQVSSQWHSRDFQPEIRLRDLSGRQVALRLVAGDEAGESDTLIRKIPVVINSSAIRVKYPNAFSPNPTGPGDGFYQPQQFRRDLFHPLFFQTPVDYQLQIYSRRGQLVFETHDPYQGWDGYIQQQRAAGGVYIWMAKGRWSDGKRFSDQGDLTLIWKEIW